MASEYESPLFKRLAPNDTGETKAHQAGFLVPVGLRPYFPPLADPTPDQPTTSIPITASLFRGKTALGEVVTRYQFQTWSGKRSPESRFTRNLSALLESASGGDYLLIERHIERDSTYRLTLIEKNTAEHEKVAKAAGGEASGVLKTKEPPVAEDDIVAAEGELKVSALKPFIAFEQNAQLKSFKRIARGRAFRRLVINAYYGKCALCHGGLVRADERSEAEAAHIIGRGAMGSDDVRNGVSLCRSHHWAFDQGMLTIDLDLRVLVSDAALKHPRNEALAKLTGSKMLLPDPVLLRPHEDALKWRMKSVFQADE